MNSTVGIEYLLGGYNLGHSRSIQVPSCNEKMRLNIVYSKKTVSFEIDDNVSIEDLITVVAADLEIIDLQSLQLLFDNQRVFKGTLKENGIKTNSTLFLLHKNIVGDSMIERKEFYKTFYEQLKRDQTLELYDAELAEIIKKKDFSDFVKTLQKREKANNEEINKRNEFIKLATESPFDKKVQVAIEEEIRLENIKNNFSHALEHHPESFSQVPMLYINVWINGYRVNAFVDSGAQLSILDKECSSRCNIERLIDKRFTGTVKGIGSSSIIGKIHSAPIQIGNTYLPCSFIIIANQTVDFILGLDMLRRHQCCIDLKNNCLVIGTTNQRVEFLAEHQLYKKESTIDWQCVSDDDISKLLALGFTLDEANEGLSISNGDVNNAVLYLLNNKEENKS